MKIKRDFVTPYLVFILAVVVISGVLMFFHLADTYTSVVHGFLGVTFAFFAFMHRVNNWNSITNYFKRRMLLISDVIISVVSRTT